MGADGCGWVRIGAFGCRGYSVHKNKTSRGKNGHAGHVCYPYGRGNFPERHVLQKISKRDTDGSGWVRMGSHGCSGMYLQGGDRKARGKE